MTNATKHILNHINENIDANNINKWLYDNELLNKLGIYYDSCAKIAEQFSLLNTFATRKISKKLFKVCEMFDINNINYVTFKGVVLSYRIYNNPYSRLCGDIDIFVNSKDFNSALELLIINGYNVFDVSSFKNEHHIVLNDGVTTLELHKNILNPFTNIDETYIRNHTETISIEGNKITTFDDTATLLHLIYHLYMDTYLATGSLYNIFANKSIPKAGRFLYRAYEIALFSEKYYNQIKWEEIIGDIKKQKLRIIFKKMIMDILEIFPEVFPQSFLHTVYNLNYVNDERDYLYKYFNESNMNNSNNFDVLLIDYINNNWDSRRENNIHKKVGENISLVKKSSNEIYKDLSCDITTEKTMEGLKIIFRVSNDDFYISGSGDYNTQTSDGVHLLLCGTEQYSYNSIFLFPKEIDGEINVVVCDVLNSANKVLDDNLIKADFSKTKNDYTITAILSNKFLKENYLSSYLYMGLVISDCSSETHHRKNELILSEKSLEWYNPIYFAKICMK